MFFLMGFPFAVLALKPGIFLFPGKFFSISGFAQSPGHFIDCL